MQTEALTFFNQHKNEFAVTHRSELVVLETVNEVTRLSDPEVAKFLKSKFFVKLSRHAYTLLKYQVEFHSLYLILHILNLNIHFEITSEAKVALD